MKIRFYCLIFVLVFGLFSRAVLADQWGCEVLLCLSNPAVRIPLLPSAPPD